MFHFALKTLPITDENTGTTLPHDQDDLSDDIYSIMAALCDRLQELEVATFSVGGFGQLDWPVDVRYDLLTVMVQMVDILMKLNKGRPVELNFPEQGIQRIVHIEPQDDLAHLTCKSFGDWNPNGETVVMNLNALIEMFSNAVMTFVNLSQLHCPSLADSASFVSWQQQMRDVATDE